MTVKSFNNTLVDLASGDLLSPTQKSNLLTQYNSNISGIQNQLGYKPTYGTSTNVSRALVQAASSAYDTSGNGGRKLVRLINGWIVFGAKSGLNIFLYVSKDNFATTPTQLCSVTLAAGTINDFALTSIGNVVHLVYGLTDGSYFVKYNKIDAITQTNINISSSSTSPDVGISSGGNVTLTRNDLGTELHFAWQSKGGTLANSFNIRYVKATLDSSGNASWGTVQQWTTYNSVGQDSKNPSIIVINGKPIVLFDLYNGSSYYIMAMSTSGMSTAANAQLAMPYTVVFNGGTYSQSSPSATVDGNGAIHVVWWGTDATDTTQSNIRYSKSTDGGVTWSAMTKLTSGNTYGQGSASITCDQNNNVYVYWEGITATSAGKVNIRSIVYNGTWGSITEVTNQSTNNMRYASLCDNLRTFTSPLVIWQDNVSPSVKFSGTWTDTPIIAETVTTSAVSNKELIDKVLSKGIGGRSLSGTVTSSGTTSSFVNSANATSTRYTVSVTGLPGTPKTILVFSNFQADLTVYNEQYYNGWNSSPDAHITVTRFNPNTIDSIKSTSSAASITNSSFVLPVVTASTLYTWIVVI